MLVELYCNSTIISITRLPIITSISVYKVGALTLQAIQAMLFLKK